MTAIAAIVIVVIAVRVAVGASTEFARGEAFERNQDWIAAATHYRRAAKWYAPGSSHSSNALDRLRAIAFRAQTENDTDLELFCWRNIRGAIMATRSFYTPHTDLLDEANRNIARLMASNQTPPIDASKSLAQREREHLLLLEGAKRPQLGWTLLALLGFITWITAAFLFVHRALDREDRWVRNETVRWGSIILLGFGLFMVGLRFA